jgi:hypothetical protein
MPPHTPARPSAFPSPAHKAGFLSYLSSQPINFSSPAFADGWLSAQLATGGDNDGAIAEREAQAEQANSSPFKGDY